MNNIYISGNNYFKLLVVLLISLTLVSCISRKENSLIYTEKGKTLHKGEFVKFKSKVFFEVDKCNRNWCYLENGTDTARMLTFWLTKDSSYIYLNFYKDEHLYSNKNFPINQYDTINFINTLDINYPSSSSKIVNSGDTVYRIGRKKYDCYKFENYEYYKKSNGGGISLLRTYIYEKNTFILMNTKSIVFDKKGNQIKEGQYQLSISDSPNFNLLYNCW